MLNPTLQIYYYLIVSMTMLYAFYKTGITKLSVLVIFVFWEGLFNYLGTRFGPFNSLDIGKLHNIFIVIYSIFLSKSTILQLNTNKERRILLAYILFTLSFWISYYFNGGSIVSITNQYFFKYAFIFFLYKYIRSVLDNPYKREYFKNILLLVLYIQIFLSIVKIVIFGGIFEPIVGSISARGAGQAVVFPIVALIFYWLCKNKKFQSSSAVVIILIFTIAVASGKRQPIVFFPIVLSYLGVCSGQFKFSYLIKFIPIALMIFYCGVRLSPSLNPQQVVWGAFDISHISRYALRYYTGENTIDYLKNGGFESGRGRIGGIRALVKPDALNLHSFDALLFGNGLYDTISGVYGRFASTGETGLDFGIENLGLVGESIQALYSLGYIGTVTMFLLAFSIINLINDKRLRLLLFLHYLWDFLFYYNQLIYSMQSAIYVLYIINYSNIIYNNGFPHTAEPVEKTCNSMRRRHVKSDSSFDHI